MTLKENKIFKKHYQISIGVLLKILNSFSLYQEFRTFIEHTWLHYSAPWFFNCQLKQHVCLPDKADKRDRFFY